MAANLSIPCGSHPGEYHHSDSPGGKIPGEHNQPSVPALTCPLDAITDLEGQRKESKPTFGRVRGLAHCIKSHRMTQNIVGVALAIVVIILIVVPAATHAYRPHGG